VILQILHPVLLTETEHEDNFMKSGTNYQRISSLLKSKQYYNQFCCGQLPLPNYLECLMADQDEIISQGFTLDDLYLTSRTPINEREFIYSDLQHLKNCGIIDHTHYSIDAFDALRSRIWSTYEHRDNQTYIFPEEEHLAFAVSEIINPKFICVLGSYYGYWASWLAPLHANAAHITLIDPDKKVLDLAESNFSKLSIKNASFICADGVTHLMDNHDIYDFFMLDAEGSIDHHLPDYRGKNIYGPLIRAATQRAASDAFLITHNIIISEIANVSYFEDKADKNSCILSSFIDTVSSQWAGLIEIGTTEGVGLAKRGRR